MLGNHVMNDDLFIDFDGNGDQLLRNLGRDYRSLQSHMLTVETAHGQLKLVRARNLDLHSKTWSSLRERRVHEVAFLRLDCAADALQAAIAALQESGKALRSAHLSMLFGRNSVIVQNNLLAVSELSESASALYYQARLEADAFECAAIYCVAIDTFYRQPPVSDRQFVFACTWLGKPLSFQAEDRPYMTLAEASAAATLWSNAADKVAIHNVRTGEVLTVKARK
jgi:hypothetical protein